MATFIHLLVTVSDKSVLLFIGTGPGNQEETLEPLYFSLWLHNLEEKTLHLVSLLCDIEVDNFISNSIHLMFLLKRV